MNPDIKATMPKPRLPYLAPSVSESLKKVVRRFGSYAEAARRMDVSYVTMFRWAHGIIRPSRPCVQLLQRLAKERTRR